MLERLDAAGVRRWADLGLDALGRHRGGDRRPQRLPGARRRHRHQPLPHLRGGGRRPSREAPAAERDLRASVPHLRPRRAARCPRQLRGHPQPAPAGRGADAVADAREQALGEHDVMRAPALPARRPTRRTPPSRARARAPSSPSPAPPPTRSRCARPGHQPRRRRHDGGRRRARGAGAHPRAARGPAPRRGRRRRRSRAGRAPRRPGRDRHRRAPRPRGPTAPRPCRSTSHASDDGTAAPTR